MKLLSTIALVTLSVAFFTTTAPTVSAQGRSKHYSGYKQGFSGYKYGNSSYRSPRYSAKYYKPYSKAYHVRVLIGNNWITKYSGYNYSHAAATAVGFKKKGYHVSF